MSSRTWRRRFPRRATAETSICDHAGVRSDGDWTVFIGVLSAAYVAWLGLVIVKFKSLELRPTELLFVPRRGHRAYKDLKRVRPTARWLALAPSVAVLALTPKVVTMLLHVHWGNPAVPCLSVLASYLFLVLCAGSGYARWVAVHRRIAALETAAT